MVKHICLLCERISTDGNLWCQEYNCPAEEKPIVYDYGQILGDVKILRLLRVTRMAAFYEAERDNQPVFLKVAHPGSENLLKREAEILRQHQPHRGLPDLQPAYQQSNLDRHPFGKAIADGEERFFEVFAPIEGEFLRDMLIENPQLWYEHVAWMTMGIADVVRYLHFKVRRLHLTLSPEMIFVRTDHEGIPRPVLLDLGMLIQETNSEHLQWLHYHWLPAYTAPELTYITSDSIGETQPATPASDVYGLGLLLYEMFAGHPAHEYQRKLEDQIREAVRDHRPAGLTRSDLPESVHKIVEHAISKSPNARYADIQDFTKDLKEIFGEVPVEKKRRTALQWFGIAAVGLVALLSAILLIASILG